MLLLYRAFEPAPRPFEQHADAGASFVYILRHLERGKFRLLARMYSSVLQSRASRSSSPPLLISSSCKSALRLVAQHLRSSIWR